MHPDTQRVQAWRDRNPARNRRNQRRASSAYYERQKARRANVLAEEANHAAN